ncbi:fumarylacetoacetate hydrolase family protein [Paenibacillus thailandensis]|uniref:Fumarylacetoacetate hydrolase family protein n=1 Tax=Paenibacillus thailandensis TaxID=393250 RepID=A0ABW5QZ87_9BACL
MRLATIVFEGKEQAAVAASGGYVPVAAINRAQGTDWSTDMFALIASGRLDELTGWYNGGGNRIAEQLGGVPEADAKAAPLYRHPRKIWGIGMNYAKDPAELAAMPEDSEPVGFMKPDTALIGPGDDIVLPPQSKQVTAEAELAIVIGKACRNVGEDEALGCIAGYAASIDVTAADIHAKNQRFLTRAKSFDTFFSFGSELLTTDEAGDASEIRVETWHNGELSCADTVSNMRYRPAYIVAFHSRVMTLLPGDVILTGTPGAVVLRDGDTVGCRIGGGLRMLANPAVKG